MMDYNAIVGTSDILMITLDTLRYDVAQRLHDAGQTPVLSDHLGPEGWQRRHSPGNFTFSAHAAIFSGFFPTPAQPGSHPRPFAVRFEGSQTITPQTCVFDAPDIVQGLSDVGYHTVCLGGVGFFNKENAIGKVLPGLFDESHWSRDFGVTDPDSTGHQVAAGIEIAARLPSSRRLFLFINVSAIHQPNHHHLAGASGDSLETHAAALRYVDGRLEPLFDTMSARAPTLVIVCSDHGTAYGEGGYTGHRVGHEVVWTVPYACFMLGQKSPK